MPLSELMKRTSWAITQDALEQIYIVLNEHTKGMKYSIEEIEARIGKKLEGNSHNTVKINEVAVIPVVGVISRRMNVFSAISGGCSSEKLISQIETALDDEDIKAIVLSIDSPGGTVNGTKEVADLIYNSRNIKPIFTHASGMMCSGGYWIGSASERVSATEATEIGSIGVVTSHYDYSEADKKLGVKRTYITSGKYKRIVNDAEPLTEEGKAYVQEILDDYYSLFVDSVATNRGVNSDVVLEEMADGRIFIASKSLDRNMIDAIESLEETINKAKEAALNREKEIKTEIIDNLTIKTGGEEKDMNAKELKEKHPDTYNEIFGLGKDATASESNKGVEKLAKQNESLKTELSETKKTVSKLERKDAVRTYNESKNTAGLIWDKQLFASGIPTKLHSKVKDRVTCDDHITDDKFDKDAFTTAVDAEIKVWENDLAEISSNNTQIIGQTFRQKELSDDSSSNDDDEDEWMEEMLSKSGDKEAAAQYN